MSLHDVVETSALVCLSVGLGVAIGAAVTGKPEVLVIGILLLTVGAVGMAVCLWREDLG